MADIRERHVRCDRLTCSVSPGDSHCDLDASPWPCDAIREADRADKLLARCQELAEEVDECGAEAIEQSDRADRAEAALLLAKEAEMSWFRGAMQAEQERDAARADAERLAETLRLIEWSAEDRITEEAAFCPRCSRHERFGHTEDCEVRLALAAHEAQHG